MEKPPSSPISKIDYFIRNYKEEKKKLPNKAIVNDDSYEHLRAKEMLIPEINKQANGSYTGYVLQNDRQKISVYKYERLSKKIKSELEEQIKKAKLPIILCTSGPVKKFKEPKTYDLAWPIEEITQSPDEKLN